MLVSTGAQEAPGLIGLLPPGEPPATLFVSNRSPNLELNGNGGGSRAGGQRTGRRASPGAHLYRVEDHADPDQR
jgi:hypothetical protein